jgi:hypothetical protein
VTGVIALCLSLVGVLLVIDMFHLVSRGRSGAVFVLARERRRQSPVVARREEERS